MGTYVVASVVIFALVLGWVGVQHAARRFARRYPELGPLKEEGGGCGSGGCAACALSRACAGEAPDEGR